MNEWMEGWMDVWLCHMLNIIFFPTLASHTSFHFSSSPSNLSISPLFSFQITSISFDRVVELISKIENDAGVSLPINDNEEISKVSYEVLLLF